MGNKIIITTGYMGSGSSAATDLVAEFANCKNDFNSHEYVFLHCPDGLFDLEDKLLLGNNALRSDEAIRTFQNRMHDLYDKKFWWVGNYKKTAGDEFKQICDDFVNEISTFNYPGYWYMHEYPDCKMIAKLMLVKPFKILFGKFHQFKKITRYKNQMRISFITPSEFYKFSKKFISNVINLMDKEKTNIILDQLLLPFNLYRIDNYFDDNTYAIVVDRDPRDVFVLNKYIWLEKNMPIALPVDVHMFCEFYLQMRQMEKKTESKKILRIHFEDMVYNYEDTLTKIKKHLSFSDEQHVKKKKRFNPDISIKNTQVFNDIKYKDEIKVIEEELSEYLYDFPYVLKNGVENTVEF